METLRGRKKPIQRVISRPNRLEGEGVALNGDGENDSETSSRPRHLFFGTTKHPSVLVVIVVVSSVVSSVGSYCDWYSACNVSG